MKKIIRKLAIVFGVEADIRQETLVNIGNRMINDSSWFSSPERANLGNGLYLYGVHLKEKKYPNTEKLRATIDDLKNNYLQSFENNNTLKKILWAIKA